jgi:hypothetical protein
MEFKPTIAVFERYKTVHVSECAVAVSGPSVNGRIMKNSTSDLECGLCIHLGQDRAQWRAHVDNAMSRRFLRTARISFLPGQVLASEERLYSMELAEMEAWTMAKYCFHFLSVTFILTL